MRKLICFGEFVKKKFLFTCGSTRIPGLNPDPSPRLNPKPKYNPDPRPEPQPATRSSL